MTACLAAASASLLVSCAANTKRNVTTHALDSINWSRHISVTPVSIPCSLAEIRIPIDSLRRLPEGASYSNREGHATASVGVIGDMVLVRAECDSLWALNLRLTEELESVRSSKERERESKEPATVKLGQRVRYGAAGALLGILMTIISQLIYKAYKKWH